MNGITRIFNNDVSIVLCGEAGQGIQTVEKLLTPVLKSAGYNVYATKEYMSRVRGGSNSTEIRVSGRRVNAFVKKIDFLIPLDKDAIPHLEGRINASTLIFGEKSKLESDREIIDVPFSVIAAGLGNTLFLNTVAVGLVLGLFGIEQELLSQALRKFFGTKDPEIIQKNIEAGGKGYALGRSLSGQGKIEIKIARNDYAAKEILISGADALALGAAAGGCNFIAAYPMTPSTGILTFLSLNAELFGIIAEQAEDEIAAVNMALGAWYAGARALVSTAGGGFALMIEGVSLAGMLESPLVVIVGQRPAPATGLPTRTEQGDLEHVLYSGHGEFPKIVLAPGTLEESFFLTQKAFNWADKFQVPVFILSDQYLADTYCNIPAFDLTALTVGRHVIITDTVYRRYAFTESGISPRGIPGRGDGLVCLDSDEHDEQGHITEDSGIRKRMVEKRLRKMELIRQEAVPPSLYGPDTYETLILSWGSNRDVVREAMNVLRKEGLASLHFSQVHPLHPSTEEFISRAENLIIVENNATCQFGKLIQLETGIEIPNRILQYDGFPFAVEELAERINKTLEGLMEKGQ